MGVFDSSFRDDFRELADDLRSLAGPDQFDIRVSKLTVIQRTWNGGFRGAHGGWQDITFADLPQQYRISRVSAREVASSGGRYEMGDIKIGPVTPQWDTGATGTTGGWSTPSLHPDSTIQGLEFIYRLTGEINGDFNLVELQNQRAFSWFIVLRRREVTPSPDNAPDDSVGL